jgi:PhnB protein
MATVNAYLTFNGTCEAAFTFYKSVFNSEFQFIGRYKDMPPSKDMYVSPAEGDYIMHVSLPISKETILMGSDSSETFGQASVIGNNVSLSINANSKEEADRLFNELSADGIVKMPMEKTFWGAYFGMFTDKFGIHWMVNFDEQPKC